MSTPVHMTPPKDDRASDLGPRDDHQEEGITGPVIQIVLGLMCLGLPLITGVAALIYALRTNEQHAAGQHDAAAHAQRYARRWRTAGWVVCGLEIAGVALCIIATFYWGM